MTVREITRDKELYQLVDEYIGDQRYLLELLRFLGRHPSTRFSRLAIIHALDIGRSHSERVLSYLFSNGVLRVETENGLPVYSLTDRDVLRRQILDLAGLDWHGWRLWLEETR